MVYVAGYEMLHRKSMSSATEVKTNSPSMFGGAVKQKDTHVPEKREPSL